MKNNGVIMDKVGVKKEIDKLYYAMKKITDN
jgi:hypothetical protein